MNQLPARHVCANCGAVHFATQCHICKLPIISADDLEEIRALHLSLPRLRHTPWEQVARSPLILGCLRNTLQASRRAKAERAKLQPENFELTS